MTLRWRCEYAAFLALSILIRCLPRWALPPKSPWLSALVRGLSGHFRRIVDANLAMAFPEQPLSWRRRVARQTFRHFAGILCELIRFRPRDEERVLGRMQISGLEHVTRARAGGKGVIVFSAHFGNWEWLPLILSRKLGVSPFSIARPLDNPLVEGWLSSLRQRTGGRIIYKHGSMRRLLRVLEENGIVCLLIDQNTVPREAVFVEFFGQPAATNPIVARLRLEKGTPLIPFFLHYEADGTIKAEFFPPIEAFGTGAPDRDVATLTQRLTRTIENQIRANPHQWLWFHRRWKTKTPGDAHETQPTTT